MTSAATHNVTSLEGTIETKSYLSPHSDIAALMVFEHQMTMTNVITRVGWEARVAAHDTRAIDAAVGETIGELVDYMLFVDEAPLPGPVTGGSGFAERFSARGPRDREGRSLYQLDLRQRLMRYPCSYKKISTWMRSERP